MLLATAAVVLAAPTPARANPVDICANQAVPPGWVVISIQTDWVCGGGAYNQYKIRR